MVRLACGGGSGVVVVRGVGARGTPVATGFVARLVGPPMAELSCRPVAIGRPGSAAGVAALAVFEATGTREPAGEGAA